MRTIWIPALTVAVLALGACSDDSGSPDGAAPAPEAGPDLALDSGGPGPDLTPDTGIDMAADGPAAAEAGGGDASSPEAGPPDAAPDASGPAKMPTTTWAGAPGGTGATLARGVAADSAGNAYVIGTYMGTVSFGAAKLVSSAPADTFVCKVSPSGKFLWAVSSVGGKGSWGSGVAADGAGHVYVTGGYGGAMTLGTTKLTASGTGSTFVAKLDAATGKFLWAVTSSGVASHDDGHLIRVDGKGEPYLAGHYIGAKQFGTVKLASGGGNYHYVARLDAKGTFKWVVPVPGRADNDGLGFGINAKGESCIAGAYRFSVTVGGKTFTSLGQDDITVPFEMTEAEITQGQYAHVTGQTPSYFKGCEACPVESVSWAEADRFCGRVGGRLPTAAEWEFAARAGGKTAFSCGSQESCLAKTAWYQRNAELHTHPVKLKEPNRLGLYDMTGNVWEWVSDRQGERRELRGGDWGTDNEVDLRVSTSMSLEPGGRDHGLGFRCARGGGP